MTSRDFKIDCTSKVHANIYEKIQYGISAGKIDKD